MYFDNEWLLNFEMTAGVRLRALFEKDLDAMPLEIADGLRRLREAEEPFHQAANILVMRLAMIAMRFASSLIIRIFQSGPSARRFRRRNRARQ